MTTDVPGSEPPPGPRRGVSRPLLWRVVVAAAVLPRVRCALHHGGFGTAHAALLAGVPQLVLSGSVEHLVTGRALRATGVRAVLSACAGLLGAPGERP